MQKAFDYIQNNREKFLKELFLLLSTKSISTRNEGVAECAQLLADMMKDVGIASEIIETPCHPVVYGEFGNDLSKPTLLIYGHYDVQPPEPLELWDTPPFEPVLRDGKIYARGSSDNKSQLFAHIKGLESYVNAYGTPPVNLKYIFEGEEEIGSPSLNPFVAAHREKLKCDIAIVSDSHIHESGLPMVILGLKGMCYAEITLEGANRDVHSMKAPCVPNPVWRMVDLLSCLKKGSDILIEGFYDDVRPLLPLEIEAVNQIPYDKDLFLEDLSISKLVENRTGDHYYYNLIFEPTCNICGIFGGFSGEGSKTIVPNKAAVKLDLRLVPDQNPHDIYDKLVKHLDKHGFGDAIVSHHGMITPSRTPIDNPNVAKISKAVAAAWGEAPLIYPGIGGAGPNYVFTDTLGVPCVVLPFASYDQNNHAPNENMNVEGFFNGIKTAVSLMVEYGQNIITER